MFNQINCPIMEKVFYFVQAMLMLVYIISISLWKTDKQEAKLMLRGASTSLWIVTLFICCNFSNDSLIPLILLLINTILIFVNSVLSKEKVKK